MRHVPLPLSTPSNPVLAALKRGVGRVYCALLPEQAAALLRGDFTLPLGFWPRAGLLWLSQQAARDHAPERMLPVHRRFWADPEEASAHLSEHHWRYSEMFLGNHQHIVAHIDEALARAAVPRLLEMGCGHGEVLAHLDRALPTNVRELIGLDLNPRMVETNQAKLGGGRMRFVCGDALEFVEAELRQSPVLTAVMSYGGVLEYLPRSSVQGLFQVVAAQGPGATIALVEPINDAHDLATMPESMPYGLESSLSHNYLYLLTEAGFSLHWQETMHTGGQRWLLAVAQRG